MDHIKFDLPSLLGAVVPGAQRVLPSIRDGVAMWEFGSTPSANATLTLYFPSIVPLGGIYRSYARLINHGKPRKISSRRLNRQQKDRAIALYWAGKLNYR